jgi:3-methylfumaryl-CoA hydratase
LQEGDPLPLCWHWLYFLPVVATSELDVDGHPKKGGFLPPVPLPRRMWAGGSIEVFSELTLGQHIRRVSTIVDVQHKTGRSGDLVFVTLRHELFAGQQLMLRERQDLVYRGASKPGSPAAKPVPRPSQWSRTMVATTPLLFRYSALTFNSHRIHYDQKYAVTEEGYSDLVVQGPLCATLLLEQLDHSSGGARVRQFNYSGIKPLMANRSFSLQGCIEEQAGDDGILAHVWILDAQGAVTLRGEAILEEGREAS